MVGFILWGGGILAILVVADRVLLLLERRQWINYRKRGLSRSGAAYHALKLESIFNPSAEHVAEIKYQQKVEEEDSGAPPAGDRADDDIPISL